jgi:hypothetical protein
VQKTKHSVKTFFAKSFFGTRQSSFFAEYFFGRVFFLHSTKQLLCRVFFLPSVFYLALGKELLCRVPEKKHSANHVALGKELDSGSEMIIQI